MPLVWLGVKIGAYACEIFIELVYYFTFSASSERYSLGVTGLLGRQSYCASLTSDMEILYRKHDNYQLFSSKVGGAQFYS